MLAVFVSEASSEAFNSSARHFRSRFAWTFVMLPVNRTRTIGYSQTVQRWCRAFDGSSFEVISRHTSIFFSVP